MGDTIVSDNKTSPVVPHQNHAIVFIDMLEPNTEYEIEISICQKQSGMMLKTHD